ncbi:flagellar hook assembly protein FlgD [Lapillicoccus jejuensis]|uniref:Flagellar basal-body rod modification protein FlgD n=1 Tax=Lapillicoccus jejuensis TaxID=402171 RepID=A0A542E4E7_9MICO|nr:flagellar hook capping FlgD N-terminal domain-containing protein [Lapillicoccus jejuensis]TQJ10159.1 flagellar basal-body rod modification protein FlgD [Lapillicoccus jejuensis]
MTVNAVVPSTTGIFGSPVGSTGDASTPTTGTSGGMGDKDTFLQLLVAQLRYQDPSNPTDSSQLMAQSAQFTSLEKMQAVADQTKSLLTASVAFGASSLIGRTVAWTDPQGVTGTGVVGGVQFTSDGPTLTIGDKTVPMSEVTSVTPTAAAAAPTAGSTAGATSGSTPA